MFDLNYSSIDSYDIVPEGVYECVISNAGIHTTQNGAMSCSFTLTIRNDVEQAQQNRTMFLNVWKKKEPNSADMQVEGFNFSQLMNIAKSAQIPDGEKFDSLNQFLAALVDRCLRVKVTHRMYNGEKQLNIDQIRGVTRTAFPDCKHKKKEANRPQDTFANQNSGDLSDFEEIISDDKLPF